MRKLLLFKRHSVDHDVANHGSFKEVIYEKSHGNYEHTFETNIDGATYHRSADAVDISFLSHWMTYKSQHSDLSSRAKNVKSVETYSTTEVS